MTTKITKKGQIVIPVELRRRYDINPGDTLELMDIGGEIVVIPLVVKNPIDAARGLLKGGKTTKEILKMVRKEEQKYKKKR
jgi:AbrB family looped-hinge helix DNA binding protein